MFIYSIFKTCMSSKKLNISCFPIIFFLIKKVTCIKKSLYMYMYILGQSAICLMLGNSIFGIPNKSYYICSIILISMQSHFLYLHYF